MWKKIFCLPHSEMSIWNTQKKSVAILEENNKFQSIGQNKYIIKEPDTRRKEPHRQSLLKKKKPCAIVALAPVPNRQLLYWEMWLLNNAAMTDILKDKQSRFNERKMKFFKRFD